MYPRMYAPFLCASLQRPLFRQRLWLHHGRLLLAALAALLLPLLLLLLGLMSTVWPWFSVSLGSGLVLVTGWLLRTGRVKVPAARRVTCGLSWLQLAGHSRSCACGWGRPGEW